MHELILSKSVLEYQRYYLLVNHKAMHLIHKLSKLILLRKIKIEKFKDITLIIIIQVQKQ